MTDLREFFNDGGTITQCKPGSAKGVNKMRFMGMRHNSARTRTARTLNNVSIMHDRIINTFERTK